MAHFRHLGLLILCVALSGCAPEKPQKLGAQNQVRSGRSAEAVIEVGAESLSVEEVQERLAALRKSLPTAEANNAQLGAIVEFELLADEAERRGYGKDPRVVNAVKDALAAGAPDEKQAKADAVAPPTVDEAAVKAAFEAGRKKRR